MASTRCGCASDSCSCVIEPGAGIVVNGTGSKTNPYVIDAIPNATDLSVQDENVIVRTGVTLLDFKGAGVTATAGAAGEVIVTIPGGALTGVLASVAAGRVEIPLTNSSIASAAVTFPAGRFDEVPVVVATVNTGNTFLLAQAQNPTTDGVLLVVFHRDAANVSADVAASWVARAIG